MTDQQLVSLVLFNHSQHAFAQIVTRHTGAVYARAMSLMHTADGAAEVTQLTFAKAYERLAQFRGDNLGGWLSQIAAHTALTLLGQERHRRTVSIDDVHVAAADEPYSDEHEAAMQRMEQAIATLPATDQQLLRLHYYEQRRTADIASALGLSQSNVLVRLHRIRNHLRQLLQS